MLRQVTLSIYAISIVMYATDVYDNDMTIPSAMTLRKSVVRSVCRVYMCGLDSMYGDINNIYV